LHIKILIVLQASLVFFSWNMLLRVEGDILYKQRLAWKDPNNVLQSWDPTLVNPCTWFHVTCNNDNSVIRVYVSVSFAPYHYKLWWSELRIGITYQQLCKCYCSRSEDIASVVSCWVVMHILQEIRTSDESRDAVNLSANQYLYWSISVVVMEMGECPWFEKKEYLFLAFFAGIWGTQASQVLLFQI
jgi:hypothetical protein